jgi:hypothetical protein
MHACAGARGRTQRRSCKYDYDCARPAGECDESAYLWMRCVQACSCVCACMRVCVDTGMRIEPHIVCTSNGICARHQELALLCISAYAWTREHAEARCTRVRCALCVVRCACTIARRAGRTKARKRACMYQCASSCLLLHVPVRKRLRLYARSHVVM